MKATVFVNASRQFVVYLSCPVQLFPVVEALGEAKEINGKKQHPSMSVQLPSTLAALRFSNALAERLTHEKLVVEVEFDENAEPTFYDTTSGNRQMRIPGMVVDFTTIHIPQPRIVIPNLPDAGEPTAEELAALEANGKRLAEIQAKRDATIAARAEEETPF